jgi:hypothetical protein
VHQVPSFPCISRTIIEILTRLSEQDIEEFLHKFLDKLEEQMKACAEEGGGMSRCGGGGEGGVREETGQTKEAGRMEEREGTEERKPEREEREEREGAGAAGAAPSAAPAGSEQEVLPCFSLSSPLLRAPPGGSQQEVLPCSY